MALHVSVLGIDGSGKSTITAALPGILAAEMKLLAGSAGEEFRVIGADEDHLAPKFQPDGLPLLGRLSRHLKRRAKQLVDNRRWYPIAKLGQMISQDGAAYRLGRRYGADIMISDGNAFLSAAGRAANYLRPASAGATKEAPQAPDLKAAFSYILDGTPVPAENQTRLPRLDKGRQIFRLTQMLGLHGVWLPDVVILLDLSPKVAIERIKSRRQKIDLHENEADLTQAREMYLKTLEAFSLYRSPDAVHRIEIDNLSPGETLRAVAAALRPHILAHQAKEAATNSKQPLGTTKETSNTIWRKVFNYRYFVHYLMAKWFAGAWREPTFFFSRLGRLFLKEGYSAGVMRVIYDQDEKQYGLMDRVFLAYPLHRAVYDRLQLLVNRIEPELETRLRGEHDVTIFTAPSGFAYDLFRPLEAIARRRPEDMRRVRLVAADLDPHGHLADELTARAAKLGIQFQFLRGDITEPEMQRQFEAAAPYDMILFVGLSSWLPKPQTIRHMEWIRQNLRADGVFVTDSFTPDAYALSGRFIGYKAHYYTPEVYKALLDYCGFNGLGAPVGSGRDEINHVVAVAPRQRQVAPMVAAEHMTLPPGERHGTQFV